VARSDSIAEKRYRETVVSDLKVAAQPGDVALRRRAELFFVIAAEIRRVLVADTKSGTGGVEIFAKHQAAGFLKPYVFLKLQRTHRRDGFEVMVKAGNAHPKLARDVFNPQRLVKVFAEMPDRFRNAAGVARGEQMGKASTLAARQ
jgi:hypothetical protein